VGCTPFYSDDPIATCRKILRWKETLQFPADVRTRLSSSCVDFVLSLLTDADRRLGRRGAKEVMQHEWLRGVDWQTVHQQPAPYAPHQAESMAESLEALRWVETGSSECATLVKLLTANFDCDPQAIHITAAKTASNGSSGSSCSSRESSNNQIDKQDPFFGYSFKREQVKKYIILLSL
jgi:hypothetical protein